jgi:hypothetical protein
MQLSPITGTFSPTEGLSFSPGDSLDAVRKATTQLTPRTYGDEEERFWFELKNLPHEAGFLTLTLIFAKRKLGAISLTLTKTKIEEGGSWIWSEEHEREMLEVFENWLQRDLGEERSFPWGGVGANYNPRDVRTDALISYYLDGQ